MYSYSPTLSQISLKNSFEKVVFQIWSKSKWRETKAKKLNKKAMFALKVTVHYGLYVTVVTTSMNFLCFLCIAFVCTDEKVFYYLDREMRFIYLHSEIRFII